MFTDDKITEIFCLADDFCKFFDSQVKKYTLTDQSDSENKRKYHREPTMSKAEIMEIIRLKRIAGITAGIMAALFAASCSSDAFFGFDDDLNSIFENEKESQSDNYQEWFDGDIGTYLDFNTYKFESMSDIDKIALGEALVRMGVFSDKQGYYHIRAKSSNAINISDSVFMFISNELERTNENTSLWLANCRNIPRIKTAGGEPTNRTPDCMIYSVMHAPGNSKSYNEILNFCLQRSGSNYDWIANNGFNTNIVCGVLSDCGLSFREYNHSSFINYIGHVFTFFDDNPIAVNDGTHMVNLIEFVPFFHDNDGYFWCNDYQTSRMYLLYPFDSHIWRIWLEN